MAVQLLLHCLTIPAAVCLDNKLKVGGGESTGHNPAGGKYELIMNVEWTFPKGVEWRGPGAICTSQESRSPRLIVKG